MAAVASRYARALVDVVSGPRPLDHPEAVEKQLHSFLEFMEQNADLRAVLASPAVSAVKKRHLIESLGQRIPLSRPARNFLFVLVDRRRIGLLGEILPLFRKLLYQRQGMVEAQVTSAAQLSEVDRMTMELTLERLTGRRVQASYDVDPALIGGAVTRIGSTVYDGSVREQLRLLRQKLSSE